MTCACSYANIFVSSPSPENLKTLFEFVLKGFDALGYCEHEDYELVQSTSAEFGKAVVRVNVFHEHRQTVQVCVCVTISMLVSTHINTHTLPLTVRATL